MIWIPEICQSPSFESFEDAQAWCRNLDERYHGDEAYDQFRRAVYEWQEGDHAEIRRATEGVIRGSHRDLRTHALLRVLAAANGEVPELYRGIVLSSDVNLALEFRKGATFFPGLSSFTTSMDEAMYRARNGLDGYRQGVLFVLKSGAGAVPIENLSFRPEIWDEREWYTAGEFVSQGVEPDESGLVLVHLRHEGVYDVS